MLIKYMSVSFKSTRLDNNVLSLDINYHYDYIYSKCDKLTKSIMMLYEDKLYFAFLLFYLILCQCSVTVAKYHQSHRIPCPLRMIQLTV